MHTKTINLYLPIIIPLQLFGQPKVYQIITSHVSESFGGATAVHVLFFWNLLLFCICLYGRSYAKNHHDFDLKKVYNRLSILNGLIVLFCAFAISIARHDNFNN